MRKWSIAVILLLGIATVAVVWLVGRTPPEREVVDPTTLPAPRWDPEHPAEMPQYRWPDDFKLQLHIVIDAPDVPEEIRGPSPPIKEGTRDQGPGTGVEFPWPLAPDP